MSLKAGLDSLRSEFMTKALSEVREAMTRAEYRSGL